MTSHLAEVAKRKKLAIKRQEILAMKWFEEATIIFKRVSTFQAIFVITSKPIHLCL